MVYQQTRKKALEDAGNITQTKVDELSPPMTMAKILGTLFSIGMPPKDGRQAADNQRIARKIHNRSITGKGEWRVDRKELESIVETLASAKGGGLISPKYIGEAINVLEDLLFEEKRKEHQEQVKKQ